MYQPVVLYIGLRYMRWQSADCFSRFISWVATIAVTLGVTAIVVVLSVMNGFELDMKNNILQLMPQVLLTTSEERLNPKFIPASTLNMLVGVTHIAPLTTSDVMLQSIRNVAVGIMLGINPEDPEPLSHYLLDVRQDELVAGQYRVILGNKLATLLDVKCNDTIRLIVPGASQFTPIGNIPNQRLFTVIGTFATNSEIDGYQLLVNQQDASRLMRYPIGYVSGWRLWLKNPLAVESLSTQQLPSGLIWRDWRERKGALFQSIHIEKNMMGLLLSLIIIIAAFNITASLGLLIIEKQSEIAILKTQGLTCRQIMLVFITQGVSIGIIGVLLGIGLGILLSHQLNYLIPTIGGLLDKSTLPIAIEPIQIVFIAILTIALSFLSTIYPSWRAANIHPAEVL